MNRSPKLVVGAVVLALVLLAVAAAGFSRSRSDSSPAQAVVLGEELGVPQPFSSRVAPGVPLDEVITRLETRLESTPRDDVSWATLGLAYVRQAHITVDPALYSRAEAALDQSFAVNDDDNFLAYAGRSALAAARHDFAAARDIAQQGLEINEYSPLLHGAVSDAQIQLGEYEAGFASVQRMLDLSPDTASLARASYTWELRGDIAQATDLMHRALDAAPTDADRAFTQFLLGELELDYGNPNEALRYFMAALASSPGDVAALAGRAEAEAALGQFETAIDHYTEVVARAPELDHLLSLGELLESLGRTDEAAEQYSAFRATAERFEANGVQPDAALVLFLADHGDPVAALDAARSAFDANPFIAVRDAYAWALHVNGRDQEALEQIEAALALGTKSALFRYHAGMIKLSLGDRQGAIEELTTALEIDPQFHPLAAPIARQTLDELTASQ